MLFWGLVGISAGSCIFMLSVIEFSELLLYKKQRNMALAIICCAIGTSLLLVGIYYVAVISGGKLYIPSL